MGGASTCIYYFFVKGVGRGEKEGGRGVVSCLRRGVFVCSAVELLAGTSGKAPVRGAASQQTDSLVTPCLQVRSVCPAAGFRGKA